MKGTKKGGKKLPIKVYNLGSAAGKCLDFTREKIYLRMDASMGVKAVSIPVFLVNEAQMDEIYPPERRRALDPERVHEWVWRQKERKMDEYEDPLRRLEDDEKSWERYIVIVATGLYLSKHTYNAQRVIALADEEYLSEESREVFLNLKEPAIFLCPKRIVDWANRENIRVDLVLDKVYYHELGHALMDSGNTPYDTIWGRTIEESLANWVAYDKFKGSEARLIQYLIKSEPAEYQGYAWLSEAINPLIISVLIYSPYISRWEWEEFYYEWRRLFHRYFRKGFPFPPWFRSVKILEETIIHAWIEFKKNHFYNKNEVGLGWKEFARKLLERV
ncbi:MAG: hypothetical protein ABDH37_08605 [Candidatus Hydrothermales bacterium]